MAQYNVALRLKYEQACPDCGESNFVEDHASGDLICTDCGVVVESHLIDERSEWRTFADSDKPGGDPNRVGGPVNPLLSNGGLSTTIGVGRNGDRGLAANLQRLQARTDDGADRALSAAFKHVSRVCGAMKLPDSVRYQANEFYAHAAQRSKAVRGRSQSAVVASVVFLACRQLGFARTFKEICAYVPDASKKEIGKIYKGIVEDLKLKQGATFASEVAAIHPANFLRRFMSSLAFSNPEMTSAVALANVVLPQEGQAGADVHRPWHGRSPTTQAGTIMYIFSMLPRSSRHPSLEDVCAVCGVAEGTIRQLYALLHPHLAELIASAGGFATAEEIAGLPVPHEKQERQQDQAQQRA